ncbi:phospholipase SGR2-like isoform X1 [Malus sylvestris]|uniref:phospholipase SGR2-like isoform X1 n=1 Tax=Malus sylvestris TaxID=3752 RepID=UPI0021ABF022|nr:phospholipase SGR2-like isoform X1 [Malus sylvestris]
MADSEAKRVAEETFPDLLKNTPSNIARLEDEIGHCKGHKKYLAQTRSPSDGGDVRWYFCKVPLAENGMAASVPKSEMVGKGEYFRFGMRDSLAIEASFLQREEELLSWWWKEYAECSEGPKERPSSSKKVAPRQSSFSLERGRSVELDQVDEERVGVPVKGGLYEVDLVKRHSFPVYWDGENLRVLRGHWFACKGADWLPLREDVSEQLEVAYRNQVWHRRTFQPSGLFAARVELQGSTPGLHALFTGEDNTWEAWLNIDASGFSSVITLGGNGMKLRRGYSTSHSPKPTQNELRQQKEEEMDDYCSQVPVRHLVFMVHGIGQRLEKSNLVDDVANFHLITASLAETHLTSHQRDSQRVLFIPCQWRKGLKLSGETAVEKCTLDGVKGLRVMLSATVHDVLYYMSPIYCQDIINSVSNQLNLLYLKFLRRNPGYDGKVSIYGHSLGSVLSYDILCHQENLSSPFPMDWAFKEHARDGKSSPDNQSTYNTPTNLGDAIAFVNNQTDDTMGSIHDGNMSAQPTLLIHEDGNAEDALNVVGRNTSDSNEFVARSMDSKQPHGDKYVNESVCKSNDMLKCDGLDETRTINCGVRVDGADDVVEKVCEETSNKDQVVKLLREEIDSLKSKISELEAKCGDRDHSPGLHQENEEVPATVAKQPISVELPVAQDGSPKNYTPYITYTKLEFKVDTFFAVGSPLGVFLALRNIRIGIGKGTEYWEEENISEEMPACRQMFNIFHPFDPVAYRIEPLVCKEYLSKRPVIIPYHKGGKRLHIGFQEFTEDLAARSQAMMDRLNFVKIKVLTVCQSRNADSLEEAAETAPEMEERSYGSGMMERVTGSEEGRIDHVLQDKTFEHPYLSAIGAHTNYWRDYDTALFILKHLYQEIHNESSLEESSRRNSKTETGFTGWSDQRETAEEEHPLTFSESTVRNFSKNANKFPKNSIVIT